MFKKIETAIAPYQKQLLEHPLYVEVKTPEHLKVFMEHHVYAVWDFMSLLKALQLQLTCTTTPWQPVGNTETRYLINEIVLAEETDINMQGQRQSHYEMYLDAMEKAGADSSPIENFVQNITKAKDALNYIETSKLPKNIKQFLKFTFETINTNKLHNIAAAFTFGREDLIPEMFSAIIEKIQTNFPEEDLTEFKYYFDRHIELDGDEHGPMALQMVAQLCDTDKKWDEAIATSIKALKVRKILWDGILKEITATAMV